jgi:hypothetical protein
MEDNDVTNFDFVVGKLRELHRIMDGPEQCDITVRELIEWVGNDEGKFASMFTVVQWLYVQHPKLFTQMVHNVLWARKMGRNI